MDVLLPWIQGLIYVVMVLSVIAAIGVVALPNIFHAALCLMLVLIGVAGMFVAMHAEFLAVVQILLYVGGVMTIVIFAVMMTERLGTYWAPQHNGLILPALGAASLVFLILFKLLMRPTWPIRPETEAAQTSVPQLGAAFLGPYLFPFEVISIILIAVLIGALIVAKRDKEPS